MKRASEAAGPHPGSLSRATGARPFVGSRGSFGARAFFVRRAARLLRTARAAGGLGVVVALAALAALAAGAALPLVANAAGTEAARVIVVSTGAGDPVAARLIDELIAGGVTVEVTAEPTDPAGVLARTRGARAVVRVEASRRAVRVWIGGAAQPETLSADAGGDADTAARALALRVVEVLRPHLLPAEAPSATVVSPWPTSPPPPASTAPAVTATATAGHAVIVPPPTAQATGASPPLGPPRADTAWPDGLSIYIAPTVLLHPTTAIEPSAGALWGVTTMVFPWAGVDVCALVPVVPGLLTTPAGKVKIATGAIGAGVLFRYPTKPSALTGWLGAGLAAGFIGYDAETTSGAVRASDGVVAHALPYARAAFEWRAWPSLGFRADVLVGLARPRPVLAIAGQADTPLEEPLLGVSLGVLTWLP